MAGNMADLGAALNNTNAVAATLAAAATSALHNANGAAGVATHDPSTSAARPAFSFRQWASDLGLRGFADLIGEAGLADLIDTSMTPLTIFAPTDDAIARLGSQRPAEAEQLRELMCVHLVSTGQLCSAELLVEKSITTIGQQSHPNPNLDPNPNRTRTRALNLSLTLTLTLIRPADAPRHSSGRSGQWRCRAWPAGGP